MSVNFHLLTGGASQDEVFDERDHSWPPVVLSDQLGCLPLARVSAW